MSFTFLIRTQFKFKTDNSTFEAVLKGIADKKINIIAYIVNQKKSCVKITLSVGLTDSLLNDYAWNKSVREILSENDVKYRSKNVVQVLGGAPGISGVLYRFYSALEDEVQINLIYLGENTTRFIDSSDNAKVIEILSKL